MEIIFDNEVYDLSIKGLRKLLHREVSEFAAELYEADYDELEEIYNLIENEDALGLIDGFFLGGEISFYAVESNDMLITALHEAGYVAERSNISRSIYAINDNGQEVRIADHKRPAIEQNGIYTDHEYENEIIVKGNVIYMTDLQRYGFTKLNKASYLLA